MRPVLIKSSWLGRHPVSCFFAFLLILLLGVRIFLPSLVLGFLNRELQQSEKFTGNIGGLDLGLFAGRAAFSEIQIVDKKRKDFEVEIDHAEIDLQWWALLQGRVRVDLHAKGVLIVLSIGDSPKKKKEDNKDDIKEKYQKLRAEFRSTWPTFIHALHVEALNFRIVDRSEMALPILRIIDADLRLERVSNRPERQEEPARLAFEGKTSGRGKFSGYLLFSGVESNPGLKGQMQLSQMDLRYLNPFFRKNANLDLESGKLDFFIEFAVRDWKVDGYLKPMLSEVKFIDLDKKKEKGFWRILWEQLLTLTAWVLKNDETDQIAAKVRFAGTLDEPDTNPFSAFVTLVRNAFIEAIQSGFDRDLKIKPRLVPQKTAR